MFPQLARFTDLGLLFLRLMVGLVFVTSSYSHLKDPQARARSIEMSKSFTIFLGAGELAGGLGVAFGVLTQLAAIGLIYFLIVVNFQSWSDPFVIITALPAALAGIVWMLFATMRRDCMESSVANFC